MSKVIRQFVSLTLFFSVLFNCFPNLEACGPYYLTPIFDYKYAPENPFADFAAGKIGIVKPSYHRVVLFAAYRYLNNGSFSADEQKALIDVWNADFNNRDYVDTDVSEAVKLWVAKRKEVLPKEETVPTIYTEKAYGGYDFFPNCTKNAFETAAQTLSERAATYGADNPNVKNWVSAQDAVFFNCANNKETPAPVDQTAPEWLQKDRAYQQAAAEFYSLDYEKAKKDFAAIADDADSPWRATADYLVARTLIRQASLTANEEKRNAFYAEAETQLQKLSSGGNQFAASSEKFMNLIKYRLRPQERVGELARTLSYGSGNDNFRQDLIDYYWLLDKFEKETLDQEEKRKEFEKQKVENTSSNTSHVNVTTNGDESVLNSNIAVVVNNNVNSNVSNYSNQSFYHENAENKDKLKIYFYTDDYKENWTIYVDSDATDEEAIAEAEKISGKHLTDKMKETIKSGRQTAYSSRFSIYTQSDYQGGYSAEKLTSISLLPDFLRGDDLTEWLFVYQIPGAEAYLYAFDKYKQTGSDLWLMTAISKAETSSSKLKELLEAASRVSRSSLAYPTVAFHEARILIEQNRKAEAVKVLDEVLALSDDLPVSSRNQFLEQRAGLAQTMDDFLRDSLKKPFAFDLEGTYQTIDEVIAQEKSYYDAESTKQTKEEYEQGVEDGYKDEKLLQNEQMFDDQAIKIINEHFPLSVLLEAEKSAVLPDYLKERIALTVWVRAVLLKDDQTASRAIPEIIRLDSANETKFAAYLKAKTPVTRQNAALYLVLKNENLSPYLASGFGSAAESYNSSASRWWCVPYENDSDDENGEQTVVKLTARPKFLTVAQSLAAQTELKQIRSIGDAPKYLGRQVLDWAKRSPLDKRVPESLSIVYEANGWDKYGCGGDEDLRNRIGDVLKKKYPDSSWTKQMSEDEQ